MKKVGEIKFFMAIAGVCAIVISIYLLVGYVTKANIFVYLFPEKINGAKRVEKYETKDAQEVLIHVRQMHDMKDLGLEEAVKIEEVQRDIKDIIKFLVERYEIKSVYKEGESGNQNLQKIRDSLEKLFKDDKADLIISRVNKDISGIEEKISGLEKDFERYKNSSQEERKHLLEITKELFELRRKLKRKKFLLLTIEKIKYFELDGVEQLRREGKISVRKTETEFYGERTHAILDLLLKVYEKHQKDFNELKNDPIYQQVVFEDRENLAISLMAEENEPVKVIVFGGKHDFSNNIREWNNIEDNKKIALIVITPASYEE